MNQMCVSPPFFHADSLPVTLFFLLCNACLVNTAAKIHNLILPFSLFLLSCRWVSVYTMRIIPVSWLPPHCLFLAHRCVSLPSGLKRLPPHVLFLAVIWIKGKLPYAQRDGLHSVERCGGLSSAARVDAFRHKSKCQWRLRALVFVRRSWCSLSRLDLISVYSGCFQGNKWLQ